MKTKKFFDRFAEEYESQKRYKILFCRWTIESIIRQIDKEKCKILDLATGNGELAIRIAIKFPKAEVTGLDISSGMINEAKKKAKTIGIKNIRFVVSSMEKMKINKADFVVSNAAFHHIKNKELVIKKVYQILPRGGKLIIGDWFKPCKKYKEEIKKLRKKNQKRTKEFDKSWRVFLNVQNKEYWKKHPKEYPICPFELKNIIKNAGFIKRRIIKSPLPSIAVVVGEK